MKRTVSILIFSIFLGSCFSQSDDDKNYRLSFIASFDYSFNKYPIQANYIFAAVPPELPAEMKMTVAGKPSFGEGIRLELNSKKKVSYAISSMMIDKGYSIIREGSINNYWNLNRVNSYSLVFLSIPIEVIYKINSGKSPAFMKSGLSFDLNFHGFRNFRPIASSFTFGVGKSFSINEILWISIEPTIRYALFDYADHVQIIPDRFDKYRPISAGIMVSLSQ